MQEWNSIPSTQNAVRCVTLVHHVSHLQQQHWNRLTLEEHVNVVDVQWGASIVFLCSSWGHLVSKHNKESSWKRPRPNRLVDHSAATWTQFLSQSTYLAASAAWLIRLRWEHTLPSPSFATDIHTDEASRCKLTHVDIYTKSSRKRIKHKAFTIPHRHNGGIQN